MKKIFSLTIPLLLLAGAFLAFTESAEAYDCNVHSCWSGTISSNTTWATTSVPYVVTGSLTVASGTTLTINPGVVVKFVADIGLIVNGNGILNAQGTSNSRIYFTSVTDDEAGNDDSNGGGASSGAAGEWDGIKVNAKASSTISYAKVRYAGVGGCCGTYGNVYNNGGLLAISNSEIASSSNYAVRHAAGTTTIAFSDLHHATRGIAGDTTGNITVVSNTIRNNSAYGIDLSKSASVTLTNNALTNNTASAVNLSLSDGLTFTASGNTASGNSRNGYGIGSILGVNQTWSADSMPYILSNFTIPSGKTLTVSPGAVIKFDDDFNYLTVNGTLNAIGSSTNEIYFTSRNDDAAGYQDATGNGTTTPSTAQWDGIKINSGGIANLTYATIRYAGYAGCCLG